MADLTLEELKKLHDKNYLANQTTREKAADDRVFAWVTQWDDGLLEDSQLGYRGEFNIIRKAQRQIIQDLRSNPIQVDFTPKDEERKDGADLLDGLYLSDDRRNSSLESYDNASLEAVDCGVGGWELYTEYKTNNTGDKNQVIRRKPIYEANNTSFPDANAKRLDKSDARNWSILETFTEDGYKDLYKELTGKETDAAPANFGYPEQSYVFPWITGQNEIYYIARFYHRTLIKDKILTMEDPLGQPLRLRESDLIDVMDELIDQGYSIVDEKEIKRWQVKLYIASGEEILKVEVVAGDKIPVVHTYGERTFIEGEEVWEGVVRLAKDPQRLRNFLLSYMADIVSRSPREKPIFWPEQIAGFERMYEENGADNNYPYYLMKRTTTDGVDLPAGPVATMPSAGIPQGIGELAIETRQAVADVADPGLPQDTADPDISGKAVLALQARLDNQSMVYQQNLKFAKRWDAEIYAGMASVVYDAPQTVTLTLPDGQKKQTQIMETIMDEETGELVTLNDITNVEFDVYAEIGPSYSSKKEQTVDQLGAMAADFAQSDPAMQKILMLQQLTLMDGVSLEGVRDYANKQLMLAGIKDPETEEEIAFMQELSNQPDEPDAATLLAQGEFMKGQAALLKEQREAKSDQHEAATETGQLQVNAFKAETDRMKVEVDAGKAGVDVQFTKSKTEGQQIDNVIKLTMPFRARVSA